MAITTDPGSGGKYFSSNSKTTDDEFACELPLSLVLPDEFYQTSKCNSCTTYTHLMAPFPGLSR